MGISLRFPAFRFSVGRELFSDFFSSVSLLCDVPTVLALVVNDVVSAVAVVVVVAEDPVRLAPITAL